MGLTGLLGRRPEREALRLLLSQARAGRSGTLVVRGEAGIGKTALLNHAREAATGSGMRVVSSVGVEAERQFAFAGLYQLCIPLLDQAGALPEPQRAALGVAFGRQSGPAPDRFLVGLAALNLLAEAAEDTSLLCLVDDLHWLDQASVQILAFVARRLGAERLAFVFALRDPGENEVREVDGLPELRLSGLDDADARTLLDSTMSTPLDDQIRHRIVAEAHGNPLALLELPRSAPPARLAGGFEPPDVLTVPLRVEDSFRRRSGGLPADTQLLLVVAAAEPTGERALLWRAIATLGIVRAATEPAESAGLLDIDTRVQFRHPLVRSAIYQAASPGDRRLAHDALAAATDPLTDPDRRAWHRAQAVAGTDEAAAADLERSAGRARARGGLAAAGAFLQRAAELSPEPAGRARRALEAAHAKHEAGASETALELLADTATGPLDALQRARLQLLRAQITFHLTRSTEVPGMLLEAARTLAPLDAALARETYLHAIDAAIITGDRGMPQVAEAARASPRPPGTPRPADLLLDGLVTTVLHGYDTGAPGLRRALEGFRDDESGSSRWLWLASRIALTLNDDDLALLLTDRHVRLARETGALATLPRALLFQAVLLAFTGQLDYATALADEQVTITQATGGVPLPHDQLILAAWRGREAETTELYTTIVRKAAARARGTEVSLANYALALLHNGLGNYPTAMTAAQRATESNEPPHTSLALPELIEAASRAGRPAVATAALEQLELRAGASGTSWGLGLAARSRALLTTGPAAEDHYREAIERLGACRMVSHLARTQLVYGEWLRREGRRHDARDQLRTAHEFLAGAGAEGFAARAGQELRATGDRPRKRAAVPTDELTAHELHIARLVAAGATSREVGAQLFLSPRTIETHLRKIFRKLGITSRRQLKELSLG
ncbi:LuxR family transcriptional regulator [Actinoplanes sp. M2I2]|uniref:helix-turn-helix transcriptional regulator n=1 Tax=Actinoplanes sp. M2I2 TaxID=1734444 RepID=UPI0024C3493D|nr:LuxR family transcriptional regulator [Actinoplanes sp. M2I2]